MEETNHKVFCFCFSVEKENIYSYNSAQTVLEIIPCDFLLLKKAKGSVFAASRTVTCWYFLTLKWTLSNGLVFSFAQVGLL